MDVKCELIIELENNEKAKTILRSVQVDDISFVDSKIEGKKFKATIKATSISSLLNTLNDFLSCISIVMNILDKD
jgi:tRNA threonylcarbamoyladenosine modification (KEOPS) complex  Pcc1 subunit